jgi:3-methylfumaryl-CoA hydratase
MTTTLDLDDLRTHIGRSQTATDVIHAGPANFLRLAFGRPEPEFRDGDMLPPAWLGLYFLPRVASDALRPDGSPRDTGVVPPLSLPRRMFAGERVRFHAPVRIGETVRRETRLADISVKQGGTGTLVFATITSRVFGPSGLALEDERRTVFVKRSRRASAIRRRGATHRRATRPGGAASRPTQCCSSGSRR